MIANQQGTAVWRWDQQEPFGSTPPDDNPSGFGAFDFPLRLPGQYYDKETALHYNMMRDYDPSIGRYVESDPIGLIGGLNTYAYVGGNPVSKTDPRGLDGPSFGCSWECYTWQQFGCVIIYSLCKGTGPGDLNPAPQRGPGGGGGMGGEYCLREYTRCSEPYEQCRVICECRKSGGCC